MTPAAKNGVPGPLALAMASEISAEMGRHHMSVRQLAERADMNHATLGNKLKGKTILNLNEVDQLANVLGVSTQELMRRAVAAMSQSSYSLAAHRGEDGITYDEIPDVSA